MKILSSKGAPAAIGPYSQGIEAGGFCYFSGQIALDPATGEMIQDSFANEVHQVFKNIGNLLSDNQLEFSNLVKVNISMTDLGKFGELNEIYSSYVNEPYPARACVGVASLPKAANVEIEVIAHRP